MLQWIPDNCPNPDCGRLLIVVFDEEQPVRNYCACGCSFTTAVREGPE